MLVHKYPGFFHEYNHIWNRQPYEGKVFLYGDLRCVVQKAHRCRLKSWCHLLLLISELNAGVMSFRIPHD